MNNILSYFGLTDARMSASEKDLPVIDELTLRGTPHTLENNSSLIRVSPKSIDL